MSTTRPAGGGVATRTRDANCLSAANHRQPSPRLASLAPRPSRPLEARRFIQGTPTRLVSFFSSLTRLVAIPMQTAFQECKIIDLHKKYSVTGWKTGDLRRYHSKPSVKNVQTIGKDNSIPLQREGLITCRGNYVICCWECKITDTWKKSNFRANNWRAARINVQNVFQECKVFS